MSPPFSPASWWKGGREGIKDRRVNDVTLENRTPLSPEGITKLLEYYLQIHGAAVGSPVSLMSVMKDFERRALESATHPPCWWKWYVDDIHRQSPWEDSCTRVHKP